MKECRNKWQWPNVRYYPGICLDGLNGAIKTLNEGSHSLHLKPRSLTTRNTVLTTHVQVEIQGIKSDCN